MIKIVRKKEIMKIKKDIIHLMLIIMLKNNEINLLGNYHF